MAYQIARVGNCERARSFLHRLDIDPDIKDIVDCISGLLPGSKILSLVLD